ncbi:rhodanese-like domain-containing protein [Culicoidibacter larvae]|uniref:Rhodanese-like domain-containing protein n=1 Tax=Culicoidibacter larvae TaxID=2579976 RepID=A0A5R8QFI6_9FIRM|nr:rhodanese-like domain-containing protein [Culicoidibacter larvae]TLG76742.1 rhodanese-like domain-containing protein [Culicoidibacter larvae]
MNIENRINYLNAVVESQLSPTEVVELATSTPNKIQHVDVRIAPAEFKKNKPMGAIEIPVIELTQRLNELSKDKLIVVSTWGPTCSLAKQASIILLENGYEVVELSGGIALWEEFNFPVEKSTYNLAY